MKREFVAIIVSVLAIALLSLAACQDKAEIANPASVFCEDHGGTLDIRTDETGAQYGECTLADGTVCDEWAYFRGECPAGYEVAEVTDVACAEDKDCVTPDDYLVRSNCPYTSKCLEGVCNVVCPRYNGTGYPDVKECGDCPLYSQPAPGWCANGTIIPPEIDECGCPGHPTCRMPVAPEKACETKEDCACGVNKGTGDCFVGNKDYVDETRQCPDFCTGIAGNLVLVCKDNACESISAMKACTEDAKICPDGSSVARVPPDCEFAACPVVNGTERHACTPESRKAEACTADYRPVCGWFGPNVQCFRAPCAITASNPCTACINANVAYWTEGECPK